MTADIRMLTQTTVTVWIYDIQVAAVGTLFPNAPNPTYGRGQICWTGTVSCAGSVVDFYSQVRLYSLVSIKAVQS